VDALDLHIEDRIRVEPLTGDLEGQGRQALLVAALDRMPLPAEVGILGQRFDALSS
jgi:hypothetical protein